MAVSPTANNRELVDPKPELAAGAVLKVQRRTVSGHQDPSTQRQHLGSRHAVAVAQQWQLIIII